MENHIQKKHRTIHKVIIKKKKKLVGQSIIYFIIIYIGGNQERGMVGTKVKKTSNKHHIDTKFRTMVIYLIKRSLLLIILVMNSSLMVYGP